MLTLADVETGTVSGKVVDESGNTPRAHVELLSQEAGGRVMEKRSLSTESDGRFIFTDVVPGTFELSYGERTTGLVGYTNSDGPYTLAPGQHLGDILLQLDRSGLAITGVLRNASGDPVPDFMLDLLNFNEESGFEYFIVTMTDENGNFVFENLEEGRYRIEPQHHDAGSWRMNVQAGETVEIILPDPEEFPESGTLTLQTRGTN